jgi:hypothetical protein
VGEKAAVEKVQEGDFRGQQQNQLPWDGGGVEYGFNI